MVISFLTNIRDRLIDCFSFLLGLDKKDLPSKHEKKLHWHVDYLLDQPFADLKRLIGVCRIWNPEIIIGKILMEDLNTSVIEEGLGASDVSGNTHLLLFDGSEGWWQSLSKKLQIFMG